jgi:hypothetical protein
MCAVLRATCETVYLRLAEDLRRQQDAGSCGNTGWWKEILAFHTRDVVMLRKPPVAVHFFAPALARLGANGEAADLVHRVISLVTKKAAGRGPPILSLRATRGGGAGGLGGTAAHLRMGPPAAAAGGVPLTVEARCAIAAHIAPLFSFLLPVLDDVVREAVQRRLFKWLKEATAAGELLAAPPPLSLDGRLPPTTPRGPAEMKSDGAKLALSVFGQCVGVCAVLGVPVDSATDMPPELLSSLVANFRSTADHAACGAQSLESPDLALQAVDAVWGGVYRDCPFPLLDASHGRPCSVSE